MASGSRHRLSQVAEATYGTTPATPIFKGIRHTGTTIGLSKDALTSEELREDRQIGTFRQGADRVGGDISAELSMASFDDILEAVLLGTWASDELQVGILRRSFTIERYFSDLANSTKPYHRFTGCEYSSLNASFAPNAIPTVTFGVVGLGQNLNETAITGATYPAKSTTDVIDTFTGTISEDGEDLCVVTELTFTLENGIEPRFVIGQESCPVPLRPSIGRSNLTGQIVAFFEDSALLDKFVNGTASNLTFTIGDGINEYTFTIPRIFYTGGQPDVAGEGDISITLPFQAVFDPTQATNFKIERGAV